MVSQLAEQIACGLREGEFKPHFQPIVHLTTGRLTGFEVLARWHHRTKGVLLPKDFILHTEVAGRIGELTQSLLVQSLSVLARCDERLRLSINISPIQLRDDTLPGILNQISAKTGFDLRRLTIEVTESGLIDRTERSLKTVEQCKRLGTTLSLDDFGTGYSSLTHLQALPFDALKIDRSFVGSMTTRRESRKIVAAVVNLGKSLGLATVAEGIEDHAQVEMLRWLGCDFGQGWLYGKAVPPDEVEDLIREWDVKMAAQFLTPSVQRAMSPEVFSSQPHAQLQAIYDGVPVGLCFLDHDLRHVSLNRYLAELNGLPVQAHLGRSIREVAPEMYRMLEPYFLRALRGGEIAALEFELPVAHPKSPATQLISIQPARDEAGEVIGISVSIVDISLQKRTEAALRASKAQCLDMLELNPQVQWVMSAGAALVDVSSNWTAVTGLSRNDSLDLGWLQAVHTDDLEATKLAVLNSLANGTPIDVQYRVRDKSGAWRRLHSRGYPKMDSHGDLVRWYGSIEAVKNVRTSVVRERKPTQTCLPEQCGIKPQLALGTA